jgi:hypothetical protein
MKTNGHAGLKFCHVFTLSLCRSITGDAGQAVGNIDPRRKQFNKIIHFGCAGSHVGEN